MKFQPVLETVFLSLLALPVSFAGARADCPTTLMSCGTPQQYSTPSGSCSGGDGSSASFDAVQGKVSGGCGYTLTYGWGSAQTEDEFQVVGIAPGTPLTLRARLALSGHGCQYASYGHGTAEASLTTPGGMIDQRHLYVSSFGCQGIQDTLLLVIQNNSGDPFRLTYYAAGGGGDYGGGAMDGLLYFEGLPEGASIVSCRGYTQNAPIATQASTWGRLKGLYR